MKLHPCISPEKTCLLVVVIATLVATVACGMGSATPGSVNGNTNVIVVASGTSNDQLSQFVLTIQSLTLTNQFGKTITLINDNQRVEFTHLNGSFEPLITATIPQGIYTAASATVGNANFTCLTLTPTGGLATNTYAYGYTPNSNVKVTLPSPLNVTGARMALSLDLQVSASASYSSCYTNGGIPTYSITPTFNLSAVTFPQNGSTLNAVGEVTAINSSNNGFSLVLPEGAGQTTNVPKTVQINSGSAVFQGISGVSGLSVGNFVELDGLIQSDGSVAATRIAVNDLSAVNAFTGPVAQIAASTPRVAAFGRLQQGVLAPGPNGTYIGGTPSFDTTSPVFQVSGAMTNLQSLPFAPSFSASNMVPGQNVSISFTQAQSGPGNVNTITLVPQTINGTVLGSSTSGNFKVYSVSVAPYDLFPALAVQPGQTTLLTNPSQIEVYADGNTQMRSTQALAPGNTARFYGLVFNDNGTLRMDCARVNAGVPE